VESLFILSLTRLSKPSDNREITWENGGVDTNVISEVREQHPIAINLEADRESGVRKDRVGPTFPNFPPTCRVAELMGRESVAARPGGSNQAQSTPVACSVGGADLNWRTAVALVRP